MGHKKSKHFDTTEMLEFDEAEMLIESEHRCSIKGKKKAKYFPDEKKHNINFVPKTENQKLALEYFKTKPIVVCCGSAGVGKTYLAAAFACEQLVKENYERFIITRNAIGIGKSIGFFPGDVNDKLSVWVSNVLGMCRDFVNKSTVDLWMKGEYPKLILQPTEVLRGQSYENSIILDEEAQQLSIEEIKCITTRIGKNSLLVLAGDPAQKDIQTNGLETFCNMVEKNHLDEIGIVRFTEDDIIRSDIVKKLVIMFEREGI